MSVWALHVPLWHAISVSHPGGRIVFACRLAIDYHPVLTATDPLASLRCPACERELRRTVQTLALHVDPVVEVVDTPQDWHGEPTQGGG